MHLHQQSIKIKQLPRSLKEHFSKLTLHFHTFGQPQERRIKKKKKESEVVFSSQNKKKQWILKFQKQCFVHV